MKRFNYKAVDIRGKILEGFMDAATMDEVGAWLAERQFHVLEITEAPFSSLMTLSSSSLTLSVREMNLFLIQLSNLLNAGCPLVLSLKALHRQTRRGNLKVLLWELKEKLEMGKSFSDALRAYPEVFPSLLITMVEVGEVAGILDQVLSRYSQMYDAMYKLRSKVIKSMIYPSILVLMTFSVAYVLLLKVFPIFVQNIQSRGAQLPVITNLVLTVANIMGVGVDYFFLIPNLFPWIPARYSYPVFMIIFLILMWKLSKYAFRFKVVCKVLDSFMWYCPLVGGLVKYFELSVFARTLGTLIKCGVPILTSLTAVEKAQRSLVFKKALSEIRSAVSRGESLSVGMSKFRDLFPESLILMADVGERGGNIGNLMEKAAEFYERDLEAIIDTLVTLLEPALVVFLSVFVVILALAMYMPLFDINRMVR